MAEQENIYDEIREENETDQTSSQKPETEEHEVQTPEERVMTEEDLERLGLSKTFLGKPYYDTIETIYGESVKWNTKLSQQISELSKEFSGLKSGLTKQEVKEVKEKVEEKVESKLSKMPDPIDDPEGFEKWLTERDDLIKKSLKEELQKELGQPVNELQTDRNNQLLWDSLAQGLQEVYGDDFNLDMVKSVLQEYGDYLKEQEDDDVKLLSEAFKGKPKSLAKEIIKTHKALNYGKQTETEEEKKARVKAEHDKKVNALKKNNKTFTQSASSPRDKATVQADENDIYKSIIIDGERELEREKAER